MAPETILGDAEVDRRADVYALGYVAYYLLTGELVFDADTSMKMLMHHPQYAAGRPRSAPSCQSARARRAGAGMSAEGLNRRPQNAGELFRMAHNVPGVAKAERRGGHRVVGSPSSRTVDRWRPLRANVPRRRR